MRILIAVAVAVGVLSATPANAKTCAIVQQYHTNMVTGHTTHRTVWKCGK